MAKDVKIFDGTAWVSIVGPPGADGVDGKDGSGVDIKGTAVAYPPAATPDVGDMWIVPDPVPAGFPVGTVAGDGLVWTGTEWNNVGGVRGPAGKDGADGADGAPGQDGQTGADGKDGTLLISTSLSAELPTAAKDGNLFIQQTASIAGTGPDGLAVNGVDQAIVSFGGEWFDLKGNAGADGAKGDKGDAGADGAKGDKGDTGTDGADGRSVAVTKSPTQPATAAIGDFWIEE